MYPFLITSYYAHNIFDNLTRTVHKYAILDADVTLTYCVLPLITYYADHPVHFRLNAAWAAILAALL